MKIFRTSPTARILSLVMTAALMGGGLIARFAEQPSHLMPILLVLCVTISVVALITGLHDHLGAVLLLTGLLTIALLPYAMVLGLAIQDRQYAGWLLAAGLVPLISWGLTWLRISHDAADPMETQEPQEFAGRSISAGSARA
ncbi:MAG TPA: hypothetical protein VH877_28060 [Polyangia bacterium]|jgi:hypothetical protein|nr:hypothetical protein [Polyangia bacterium]